MKDNLVDTIIHTDEQYIPPLVIQKLKDLFKYVDSNNDNKVTKKEIKKAMKLLKKPYKKSIVKKVFKKSKLADFRVFCISIIQSCGVKYEDELDEKFDEVDEEEGRELDFVELTLLFKKLDLSVDVNKLELYLDSEGMDKEKFDYVKVKLLYFLIIVFSVLEDVQVKDSSVVKII